MFDPTVYDNLKVGFENHLYDLDNLDEIIQITGRKDQLEMATMSKEFSLRFCLRDRLEVSGEVVLRSSLKQLSDEILETAGGLPGCSLELCFALATPHPDRDCPTIRSIVEKAWPEQKVFQHIQYSFEDESSGYNVSAYVQFDRNVNEDQMRDIPALCDHMIDVLNNLVQLHK